MRAPLRVLIAFLYGEIGAVLADGGMIGKERLRALVEGAGAFSVSEGVIAADEAEKGSERACGRQFKVSLLTVVAAGERRLIPENGFPKSLLRKKEAAELTADGGARLPVEKTAKERALGIGEASLFFQAEGKDLARFDQVDIPAACGEGFFKSCDGLRVEAVVVELPPVIEEVAGRERLLGGPLLIDAEIAVLSLLPAPEMMDVEVEGELLAEGGNALVDTAHPMRFLRTAEDALAAEGEGWRSVLTEGGVVGKEEDIGALAFQKSAKGGKPFTRWGRENVVGVQPEEIVSRRPGKGEVARLGKVVLPGKGEHFVGKPSGDRRGLVGRAGIDEYDLVKQARNARKTA